MCSCNTDDSDFIAAGIEQLKETLQRLDLGLIGVAFVCKKLKSNVVEQSEGDNGIESIINEKNVLLKQETDKEKMKIETELWTDSNNRNYIYSSYYNEKVYVNIQLEKNYFAFQLGNMSNFKM